MRSSLLLLLCLLTYAAFGQSTVTGTVLDADTGETLIGASVLLKGTVKGSATDIDGNFAIVDVPDGEQTFEISYTGFQTQSLTVTVSGDTDLGEINLATSAIGLAEVEIIASVAIDRKTPVAASTIPGHRSRRWSETRSILRCYVAHLQST